MKKYVKILFTVSLVLVALMLGIFLFHESFHEYIARAEARCEFLTDYEKTTYENPDAPVGITQEYRFTLSDIPKRGGCFMFYTIHQNIY